MRWGDTSVGGPPQRSRNVAYLPGVDLARGAAAGLMVLYHAMQQLRLGVPGQEPFPNAGDPLRALLVEGHSAVALFMVLSGFILTYGADRRTLDPTGFWRNRALRVLPMYLVVIAAGVATHPVVLQRLLPYVTFVATPPVPYADLGAWSAVLWTVSVEVAFYLMFPFLLALLRRHGLGALVAIVVVLAAGRVAVAMIDPVMARDLSYWTIIGRLDQFLIGMVGAWVLRRRGVSGWWLAGVSMALIIGGLDWFNHHGSFYGTGRWRAVWPTFEGLAWCGVIVGVVAVTSGRSGRLLRFAALPGVVSYSMYLLHYPVVQWVVRRSWAPTGRAWVDAALLSVVVVLPVTLVLSTLGYVLVERPFMARRGRYLGPAS